MQEVWEPLFRESATEQALEPNEALGSDNVFTWPHSYQFNN